jgi:hypothetical protein
VEGWREGELEAMSNDKNEEMATATDLLPSASAMHPHTETEEILCTHVCRCG